MKKLIVPVLCLLFTSQTFAQNLESDFACREAYTSKLDKIKSKKTFRESGLVVSSFTGVGVAYVWGIAAATVPVIALPIAALASFAAVAATASLDRETGLLIAFDAFNKAPYTESDLLEMYHEEVRAAKEANLQNTEWVSGNWAYANKVRAARGEEAISLEDWVESYRSRPLPEKRLTNGVDRLLSRINNKLLKRGKTPLEYEDLRLVLLREQSSTDYCSNGKPVTAKKIAKKLVEIL